MSKPKVFVLNPYHPEAIALLQQSPEIDCVLPDDANISNWHDQAHGILIRSDTKITSSDISHAPNLKVIVKQGVGVDNIDLSAAKEHGIIVCNTPAMNSETVAELTLTLALCIARRIQEIDRKLLRGKKLIRSNLLGQSLHGKTLGIIGMGNIGKQVARKWIGAMEGKILAYDPMLPNGAWGDIEHRRIVDLDELLKCADVVTLHVPLTDTTRGMIGKREFNLMRKNAIFLNCARGGLVDEEALLEALEEDKIFGAALDALEIEPPTLKAYNQLLACENFVLTPHVGATTDENQRASGMVAVETLLAVLVNGEEVTNRLV
ncbi:related to SER3-3-phosphoglycerate dehydrogenase [Ramularia collo-cygni]|uniref:Related to SER3-3-phosphoglycerate dehydrogenase n=1 Tax=Ramularia collo-cygni TaxID=112498 RepID=A0A2D3VET4_9PEZI|nr:related to SER3-3-phosphoglycerate dehydrogenase [Ramularia collo-cygni]CZT25745.1 related to SER3-3-phosphoglycerate dehydrogenase [Ramularia collo-cygni]